MEISLITDKKEFPDSDWREFLKCYDINWHKTRSNSKANIWHPIERKGFVIWVSDAHIFYIDNKLFWRVIIELKKSENVEGQKLFNEIKREAIKAFDIFKVT